MTNNGTIIIDLSNFKRNSTIYEVIVDGKQVGQITSQYQPAQFHLPPGKHFLSIRTYGDGSPIRAYNYTQEWEMDLSVGDIKKFKLEKMSSSPIKKLIPILAVIVIAIYFIPLGLSEQDKNIVTMCLCSTGFLIGWYDYSSKPGASIYLAESKTDK